MTKERAILAFVAIITGLIVAISTFSFYQQKKDSGAKSQDNTNSVNDNTKSGITIDNPENESVTDNKTTTIKGSFIPKALIVINTSLDDFVTTTDEDGKFSQEVGLSDNENIINVTGYGDNGTTDMQTLIITQNSEEF